MNLAERIKMGFLFASNNYQALLNFPISKLKCLNETQALKLAQYAAKKNNDKLCLELMDRLSSKARKFLIEIMYKDKQHVSYRQEFNLYFEDFLEVAKKLDNQSLMYHLAAIASKNNYLNLLDEFRVYFLNKEVSTYTIAVFNLESFDLNELDDKIIASQNLDNIIEYLEVSNWNNEFVKKLLNKSTKETIKQLITSLDYDENATRKLIAAIVRFVPEKKVKSEYFLLILKSNLNTQHHRYLVSEILIMNVFMVVKELVPLLAEEEQEKYAKEALNENLEDLIFTLACVTNNKMTQFLIDRVVDNGSTMKVAYLLFHLESENLDYALSQTFVEGIDSIYYKEVLSILYMLYSPNWTKVVAYLKANNLMSDEELELKIDIDKKNFIKERVK